MQARIYNTTMTILKLNCTIGEIIMNQLDDGESSPPSFGKTSKESHPTLMSAFEFPKHTIHIYL